MRHPLAGRRVGDWFTGRNVLPERTWETRSEVVVAERGREFAFIVGGSYVWWGYAFAALGEGTRLTESWEFLPEGIAMFEGKFGADAQTQIALRTRAAHEGIPVTAPTLSDCAQHQKELPTACLDLRCNRELRREPGQPIHEPYGGLLGFRPTRAAGHHLSAALAGQPLNGRHDRGRLHDEQVRRPGHDRLDRALARVAGPVRKALHGRGSLLALRRSAAVDAWTAGRVDGRVGVDRLIA